MNSQRDCMNKDVREGIEYSIKVIEAKISCLSNCLEALRTSLLILDEQPASQNNGKNHHSVEMGKLGGSHGGAARAQALPPERSSEIAREAANARCYKSETPAEENALRVEDYPFTESGNLKHGWTCGEAGLALLKSLPDRFNKFDIADRVKSDPKHASRIIARWMAESLVDFAGYQDGSGIYKRQAVSESVPATQTEDNMKVTNLCQKDTSPN